MLSARTADAQDVTDQGDQNPLHPANPCSPFASSQVSDSLASGLDMDKGSVVRFTKRKYRADLGTNMAFLALALITLGIFLIYKGIKNYMKPFYADYLTLSPYGSGFTYNAVPFGLMALLCGIGTLPFVPYPASSILIIGGALLGLVGLWISYSYFDPPWIRQLKEEHGTLYNLLRTEAARAG